MVTFFSTAFRALQAANFNLLDYADKFYNELPRWKRKTKEDSRYLKLISSTEGTAPPLFSLAMVWSYKAVEVWTRYVH